MSFKPGDRIQYSQAWLQSVTGGDPCNALWFYKGTYVGQDGIFALVEWDGDGTGEISYVHPENLAKPGSDKGCRIDAKGWTGYEELGGKPRNPFKKGL